MPQSYEDRILRVVEYIHDNPAGDLSLDTLADIAAMSRFHWHRVYRAMTGETCAQAVRRIRLHRAASWLVEKDWPVAEVAARCGYPNLQSFTRVFGESYGMAPAAFRKHGRFTAPLFRTQTGERDMHPVEITEVPARNLAAMAHKGPYIEIGRAFEKLAAIITARNLWSQARGMIGVFYDDPDAVAEADLRSHAGLLFADGAEVPEALETVTLPEGRVAVLHYKGPYTGLKAAYGYLYGDWLPKSGEVPRDTAPYEMYLNDPMDTAPEDLLTDICVPIQ